MQERDEVYRIYVTDALKILGGLNIRWFDALEEAKKPQDNRTAEEIINHFKQGLKKVV